MNYLVKRNAIYLHENLFGHYPHGSTYALCRDVAYEGGSDCAIRTILSTDEGVRFKLTEEELKQNAIEISAEMADKLRVLGG